MTVEITHLTITKDHERLCLLKEVAGARSGRLARRGLSRNEQERKVSAERALDQRDLEQVQLTQEKPQAELSRLEAQLEVTIKDLQETDDGAEEGKGRSETLQCQINEREGQLRVLRAGVQTCEDAVGRDSVHTGTYAGSDRDVARRQVQDSGGGGCQYQGAKATLQRALEET
ncbi:hypothetical protein V8E36_000404 [Tilletia maclaganii]